MRTLRNRAGRRVAAQGLLLAAALLVTGITAADPCRDVGPNSPCKPFGAERYNTSLATMHASEVPADFRGQGTTVVQIEPFIPRIDAYDRTTGTAIFGDCSIPRDKAADAEGWAPGGDNCRIKWVRCFGVSTMDGSVCKFDHGLPQNHATMVAQGIVSVAPATNIISLKLPFDFSGEDYAAAVDWLLTPVAELDGKSPAEHWNVVALNVSHAFFGGRIPDSKVWLRGLFTDRCELENPDPAAEPQPQKYIDDWLRAHNKDYARESYAGYQTHSAKLLAAGILPIFGANNELTRRPYKDAEGKQRTERFVSSLGISFPGCLDENFFVAAIAPDYPERTNKWRFIGSNSHPDLTTVVAPGGATSFSAPLVSGAVALLRSPGLAPDATVEEVLAWLTDAAAPRAPAGISCVPVQDPFPPGAASEIGCVEGALPYELPVLDLAAAVRAAQRDQ